MQNTLIAGGPDPTVIKSVADNSFSLAGTSANASSAASASANGIATDSTSAPKDAHATDPETENSLMKFKKDGALHQCINELSSNLRNVIDTPILTKVNEDNVKQHNSSDTGASAVQDAAPSHFVTVIEVKESMSTSSESMLNDSGKGSDGDFDKDDKDKSYEKDVDTAAVKSKSTSSQVLAAVLEAKKKVPPR